MNVKMLMKMVMAVTRGHHYDAGYFGENDGDEEEKDDDGDTDEDCDDEDDHDDDSDHHDPEDGDHRGDDIDEEDGDKGNGRHPSFPQRRMPCQRIVKTNKPSKRHPAPQPLPREHNRYRDHSLHGSQNWSRDLKTPSSRGLPEGTPTYYGDFECPPIAGLFCCRLWDFHPGVTLVTQQLPT